MSEDRRTRPLSPALVAQRLSRLRGLAVVERDEQARERLERERPRRVEPFALAVARRLDELKALCEMTRHLQRPGSAISRETAPAGEEGRARRR